MYDELVKKIRHCATDPMHCLSCGEDKDGRCFKRLMTQAADAIEELQQIAGHYEETAKDYFKDVCYYLERVPKWIPVEERLPEDLKFVLAIEDGIVFMAHCEHYYGGEEVYVEWHDIMYYPVSPTHWMPLPEPPEEE